MQDPKKIFFLCDGEVPECKKTMCYKNTNDNPCRWTSDIKHAKNFKDHGKHGTYYEEVHELNKNTHRNGTNYFVIVAVSVVNTIITGLLLTLFR